MKEVCIFLGILISHQNLIGNRGGQGLMRKHHAFCDPNLIAHFHFLGDAGWTLYSHPRTDFASPRDDTIFDV